MDANIIHGFSSERQAMMMLVVLARTTSTGGRKCFAVDSDTYVVNKEYDDDGVPMPGTGKTVRYWQLRFLPDQWQKVMNAGDLSHASPPSIKEMSWFVRGYMRALTGKRPTVL